MSDGLLDAVDDYIFGKTNLEEAIKQFCSRSYMDEVTAVELLLSFERDNVLEFSRDMRGE